MFDGEIEVTSAGFKIPWGIWDLKTGEWLHNHLLTMSKEKQHADNVKNGYSCEHGYMPDKCPICMK
jgi:hypothetical protein